MIIRMDIWGGENSSQHVAREHYEVNDPSWKERASAEMRAGFLVNMRMLEEGEGWGPGHDFDRRKVVQ